jgi:hypothetical protein
VAGAVVAHEHHVVLEVHGVELGEGAAGAELSMIFMAMAFLTSYSPATGMPRAVSSEVPRMMELMVSSLAALPAPL